MKPPTLQQLRETNRLKANKALEDKRHHDTKEAAFATQETILKAFRSLVSYLDNPQRVTKTSIVNQLTDIGTPDAFKVVDAIKDLHTTVKTHENTDLSEVANLLKGVLAEAKLIPKSHKDISIPEPIDNTKQLVSLEQAIKAVDKSIKAQKLVAEAPVVNIPAPNVSVDAPDLKPIKDEQEKTRKELVKAVKGIILPETDIKPLEKQLKKLNKLFDEFLDSVPAGGGGGGGIVSFVDSAGNASPVTKNPDGTIPVSASVPLTSRVDTTSTAGMIYIGKAAIGSSETDAVWQINRINTNSIAADKRWAMGSAAFTNKWSERVTPITYS